MYVTVHSSKNIMYAALLLQVPSTGLEETLISYNCHKYCVAPRGDQSQMYTHKRVETLIVATIYLQLIQNRYMFRSFTVFQCSHQHCVQPVASDVEVVGYL